MSQQINVTAADRSNLEAALTAYDAIIVNDDAVIQALDAYESSPTDETWQEYETQAGDRDEAYEAKQVARSTCEEAHRAYILASSGDSQARIDALVTIEQNNRDRLVEAGVVPEHYKQYDVKLVMFEGGFEFDMPAISDDHQGNLSNIQLLNRKHCVLLQEGGKTRVLSWEDGEGGGIIPVLQTFKDFENRYCNQSESVDKVSANGKPFTAQVPLGKWWLEHPSRRQYISLKFDPKKPSEFDGYLNLWQGWGVEPRKGDWSVMKRHILEVLASGNQSYADYIMNWMAWSFQNPDKPAGVALVFKGKRGTGKGIFGTSLCRIFGAHSMQVSSSHRLTGNFNAHLRTTCLLFADEAMGVADKKAESVLKTMITEPMMAVERKGLDVITAKNYLHIVMASNEQWVIPAGQEERRFAVFEVSDKYMQHNKHFNDMSKHMKTEGDAAMLSDMLEMDLGEWNPYKDVPQTAELAKQKARSLRNSERYMYTMLESGELRAAKKREGDRLFVPTRSCAEELNIDQRSEPDLAAALKQCGGMKAIVTVGDGRNEEKRRAAGYWMPPLREAREYWSRATGINPEWSDMDVQEWSCAALSDDTCDFNDTMRRDQVSF